MDMNAKIGKKHYMVLVYSLVIFVLFLFFSGEWDNNESSNTKEVVQLNRCLDVPKELIESIESWLTINGWWNIIKMKAVKSKDFDERYFISWFLQWEWFGVNDTIATFTVSSLDVGNTLIGSVNSMAKEFSQWPTPKIINSSNDWIKESEICIKN